MRVLSTPKNLARALGASAIAAGLAFAPVAAQAGDPNREYRTAEVFYGDLDLTEAAGKKTLERRVRQASRKVCSPAPRQNLREKADYDMCMDQARNSSRRAVVEILAAAQSGEALASNGTLSIGN